MTSSSLTSLGDVVLHNQGRARLLDLRADGGIEPDEADLAPLRPGYFRPPCYTSSSTLNQMQIPLGPLHGSLLQPFPEVRPASLLDVAPDRLLNKAAAVPVLSHAVDERNRLFRQANGERTCASCGAAWPCWCATTRPRMLPSTPLPSASHAWSTQAASPPATHACQPQPSQAPDGRRRALPCPSFPC